MTRRRQRILIGVAGSAIVVLILAYVTLKPRLSVTVEHDLVGPDDEAITLVQGGAALSRVQDAVRSSGKDVDAISWMGASLLTLAVDERRVDITEWLLLQGANPNGLNPSRAPLRSAIWNDDLQTVTLLLEYGANPRLDLGDGMTLRDVAALHADQKIVDALDSADEHWDE